ncbi:hypothetical protein D9611_005495 [Ephemerocybe angulata]|uniref:CHAT domain-containing protein n=1 Tax=Ephemerocybe angulata TaxID=980116 RepID=A0A8H5C0H7_9AGAR|nr:hypothetical protein D9611_005495 [Tulosesus angulatus]
MVPHYVRNLDVEGLTLRSQFLTTGDVASISNSIAALWRALELTPDSDSAIPFRYNNLGVSFEDRFCRTGDLNDLSDAILAHEIAVGHTPAGSADMPSRLSNLGVALLSRFDHTGDTQDLDRAFRAQKTAVELTLEGDASMPSHLTNLGAVYLSLFARSQDLLNISEAISLFRKAVALTPEGHANIACPLNNLGLSLRARFKHTGNIRDLAEAIIAQQRAVERTPEGYVDMPSWLSNLGVSLITRFRHTGDPRDMVEAIATQQRAVELTPEGHSNMHRQLASLGGMLLSRFDHTGDHQDLAWAIMVQQRALVLTGEDHASMPFLLNSLSQARRAQFRHTGNIDHINEALSIQRRAASLTPAGHANMPSLIETLCLTLKSRFEHTADPSDIDEAIRAQKEVVELTAEGHPSTPQRHNTLGTFFESRFYHLGDRHALAQALYYFKSCATSNLGSPHDRLSGSQNWAQTLIRSDVYSPELLSAYDTTIRLITLIATLEQTLQHRYSQLQNISGLPLHAAAAAFAHGRPDKALEWLEQGRCLVWRQLTKLRSPLDELRRYDSHLADTIMSVSKQLEAAGSSRAQFQTDMPLSEKISLEDEARKNFDLSQQFDCLLAKVRAMPGFETFLEPSPCYTLLQHLPEAGYVFIINVDEGRCDAIALVAGRDTLLHITLPTFSLAKCNHYREDLSTQLRSYDLRDRGSTGVDVLGDEDRVRAVRSISLRAKGSDTLVRGILRGLWEEVVKPILVGVKIPTIDRSSGEAPPRIWWCPTGPLSFLPIHAAGIYDDQCTESVMDYAVSSYTPTVAALTDRVRNNRQIDKEVSGLLLTSQPNTPGGSAIPGTTREVRAIYDMATSAAVRAEKLEGSAVTSSSCLDSMARLSSVHLACHASQDADNPLRSRFSFHDGSLDLASILQRDLKNADLAFLSACQTSTGVQTLPDEAVHLAAGMLSAGYRRVVATMWSIGDHHAPDVAVDFYRCLLDRRDPASGGEFDGTNSAHALHHAIQQLRLRLNDNSDQSLLAWIPYVHFGY